MGLFGRSARANEEESLAQKPHEDLPDLSEPPKSTRVAAGATVSGTMRGEGVIEVEGTVEGEIDLKGAVMVAPTGLVKGPVTAEVIHIAGRIEGVVCARERLLLQKTGSLEGDMTTPSLVVEDGGRLNGRSTMPPHAQPSGPRPSSPSKPDKADKAGEQSRT